LTEGDIELLADKVPQLTDQEWQRKGTKYLHEVKEKNRFGIKRRTGEFKTALQNPNDEVSGCVFANDPDFVGGALAVPHKQAIAQWLGNPRLDASAQGILAVNALMRDTTGQLRGANTDGLAAAQVLLEGGLGAEDFVLVFGFGGAAKAVINAIRHQVARVQVVTRSHAELETQTLARWMSIELMAPEAVESVLTEATVIINGTSLGSLPDYVAATPLPPNFADVARHIRIAFDVVYQPAETRFLASMPAGVIRLGGGRMNFLQAVQAFQQVHPEVPADFIKQTMQQAIK
jgi:shikimate dehydrogenase